ncbi:hypothetical protein OSTOST_08255 [Ostertagia ostertagi]
MSATFTCRPLHTLSHTHEFVPPSSPTRFHHRLVVASKYHIAVALAKNHELVAFRSSVLHQPTSGIVGDAKVQTKITSLDSKTDIVSIGLNADETLLGVFGHTPQGCFVYIFDILTLSVDVTGEAFPISTVRIGNSASKGLAFEWNPAVADMFAASDSERTLSVVKIDLQNSSKYTMVGEKKLEGNISEISWSPKGKQLVVGDVRGKIYQLKPELELVRTTNAPENAGSVVVINLSWLSTTDWLVAYSNAEMTTTAVFMLSIKKDKPPSWSPLNFPPQSSLGVTRRLLVDWNIALVLSPSSPDLVAICKLANSNAWISTSIATLPQPSNAKFAIGVAVDLSNQNMVTIGDGSSRRLPVVVVLYSDGSALSLQLAPPSKDYPDCNVLPAAVDVTQSSLTAGGLSLGAAVPAQKPPSGAMFTGFQVINDTVVQVTDSAEAAKKALAVARASAIKSIETFSSDWHDFHELLHSFRINMQKVEDSVNEAVSSLSHSDNLETVEEIRQMVIELDDEMQDILAMLAGTNTASMSASTPTAFKFTTGLGNTGGSLFAEKQSSMMQKKRRRAKDTSLTKFGASPLVTKPLFGGLSTAAVATTASTTPLASKSLFATSTKPLSTIFKSLIPYSVELGSSNNEKKDEKPLSIFGTKEPSASVNEEKKEEKQTSLFWTTAAAGQEKKDEKPSSLFGGLGSLNVEKKEEKPSSLFGGLGAAGSTTEKKDEKPTSLFGGLGSSGEKKEEKTSSLFGGGSTTLQSEKKEETQSSIFGGSTLSAAAEKKEGQTVLIIWWLELHKARQNQSFGKEVKASDSEQSSKPSEPAVIQDASKTSGGSIFASSAGQAEAKIEQGPASSQASGFGSIFGGKPLGTAGAVTTSSPPAAVTFSFKPKTATESQPAATSSTYSFGAKPFGFAAAAASAAATADTDEGMDDDGVAGGTSQATSSIFGGGFMSGIGSSASSNANKNVFGMGSSSLLKTAAKQETSSIFSKPQTSVFFEPKLPFYFFKYVYLENCFDQVFGSNAQPSSFASAAQKAAQSSSPMSSSVFGAAPKFGGPPVFGGKPVFGSPTQQPSTAFGGAAATSGGFSAFSGNKNLFGGVASSGGSSLFGGGMSNQTQQKPSSLFGGGQQASSFSTWR